MQFSLLNSHTSYYYKITGPGMKGSKPREIEDNIKGAPCFHRFFYNSNNEDVHEMVEMGVTVFIDEIKNAKSSNNMMLISMSELEEYLEFLKKTVNFEWEILKKKSNPSKIKVIIKSRENTHFENKWILSSVRNVYEYPQSLALKETFEAYKAGFFSDEENMINVFNAVIRSLVWALGDQCVSKFTDDKSPTQISLDDLKEKLTKRKNISFLNELYSIATHKSSLILEQFIKRNHSKMFEQMASEDYEEMYKEDNVKVRCRLIHVPVYNELKKITNLKR